MIQMIRYRPSKSAQDMLSSDCFLIHLRLIRHSLVKKASPGLSELAFTHIYSHFILLT